MLGLDSDSVSLEEVNGVICKLAIEHWKNLGCNIIDGDFDERN